MAQIISPLAGKPAPRSSLVDIPKLISAYYSIIPDPAEPSQRVAFGTSGHRGNAFDASFNERHVLAITQAICDYRAGKGIDGPLFIGIDTHALSEPALRSALEVLAANGVDTMLAMNDEYTPTPAVSHAIITHNRERTSGLADGIVVTPSHNPPDNGGFKYNPTNGGPAADDITKGVQDAANAYLEKDLARRQAHDVREGAGRAHHASPRLPRRGTWPTSATWSTWPPSATRRSTWASIRWAAPACTTGAASPTSTGST